MSTEILVAVIAAAVALVSALITIRGQYRTVQLQHDLESRREAATRQEQAEALRAKYRDPLLLSAFELQSRLYNMVKENFLGVYFARPGQDRDYAVNSTLYVIAQFFGWVEILRHDVRFLDLGEEVASKEITDCLENISELFRSDKNPDPPFRLFRLEQRAIGEMMMAPTANGGLECIGYARFSEKLNDDAFAKWFSRTIADIKQIAQTRPQAEPERVKRIREIQHTLIDLMNTLDAPATRYLEYREKLP